MKIIYQILLGILVAAALSFAFTAVTAPHPVIKQPTVITPVPTPQVVYVTNVPAEPVPPELPDSWILMMLPIMIVAVGLITIVVGALAVAR